MLRLKIEDLPNGARGVHKVEKVKVVEQRGLSVGLILLDNLETFMVFQHWDRYRKAEIMFTSDEQALLCSEGKKVELVKVDQYGREAGSY